MGETSFLPKKPDAWLVTGQDRMRISEIKTMTFKCSTRETGVTLMVQGKRYYGKQREDESSQRLQKYDYTFCSFVSSGETSSYFTVSNTTTSNLTVTMEFSQTEAEPIKNILKILGKVNRLHELHEPMNELNTNHTTLRIKREVRNTPVMRNTPSYTSEFNEETFDEPSKKPGAKPWRNKHSAKTPLKERLQTMPDVPDVDCDLQVTYSIEQKGSELQVHIKMQGTNKVLLSLTSTDLTNGVLTEDVLKMGRNKYTLDKELHGLLETAIVGLDFNTE